MNISSVRGREGKKNEQHEGRSSQTTDSLPIAFKLGADGTSAGTEEVVAYDPVALVFEHAFIEGFYVASVGG